MARSGQRGGQRIARAARLLLLGLSRRRGTCSKDATWGCEMPCKRRDSSSTSLILSTTIVVRRRHRGKVLDALLLTPEREKTYLAYCWLSCECSNLATTLLFRLSSTFIRIARALANLQSWASSDCQAQRSKQCQIPPVSSRATLFYYCGRQQVNSGQRKGLSLLACSMNAHPIIIGFLSWLSSYHDQAIGTPEKEQF